MNQELRPFWGKLFKDKLQNKRQSGDKNFADPSVVMSVKVRGVATGC